MRSAEHYRCVCIFTSRVMNLNDALTKYRTLWRFRDKHVDIYRLLELKNPTFIIHFSERVRGCCPSCACFDCVAEQPCRFTQLVRCAPGCYIHQHQSAKTICGLQTNLSRFPFLSLCFPLQKKSPGLASFLCSTLAALLFFFHYLVRFSSSLCLPLHRSHHQLFLLLLLLLLPFAHIDSAFSASRP